jgi:pimeloyl-ACP methyl ester carboxylesterase
MPFNLAVFDINAAEEVYPRFSDIDTWYIGGHSLGGAMASSYADGASKKLAGIILLGAYSVGEESIPTLAIYGSQDQVLDKSKLNPSQLQFMIEGGNHANFGNYGNQKGDGVASISREEQQQKTVDSILNFMTDTSK